MELLEAVAEGRAVSRAELHAFVLSVPEVAAGLEVLAGGPHALDRAIELARTVIRATEAERPASKRQRGA